MRGITAPVTFGLCFVLLTLFWFDGDVRLRSKIIMTAIYIASWAVFLLPGLESVFGVAVQGLLALIMAFIMYGPEVFR
jgi:hypothetical protein